MTQWCDLDFAEGWRLDCQLLLWVKKTCQQHSVSWSGLLDGSNVLKRFLGPLLKIMLPKQKENIILSGYILSVVYFLTWGACIQASTEYTYLLLDERLVFQWLGLFTNSSQKKMFLTSLWSPALGGYVCKYFINSCSVLAFFKVWLAKLVIPERGLFYRPFENEALAGNSSKASRIISES